MRKDEWENGYLNWFYTYEYIGNQCSSFSRRFRDGGVDSRFDLTYETNKIVLHFCTQSA